MNSLDMELTETILDYIDKLNLAIGSLSNELSKNNLQNVHVIIQICEGIKWIIQAITLLEQQDGHIDFSKEKNDLKKCISTVVKLMEAQDYTSLASTLEFDIRKTLEKIFTKVTTAVA